MKWLVTIWGLKLKTSKFISIMSFSCAIICSYCSATSISTGSKSKSYF